MKTKFILIICALVSVSGYAQEYKVAKSTGRLEIREVNHVAIEGTTGNEIIFSAMDNDRNHDDRSKGLRAISSMGLEDNTGLGISVIDNGKAIEVRQLKKMDGPDITIKVPKGVVVSYHHSSPYGDEIEIKNFDGEVEVSTVHNGVELTNTTGPLHIKTIHGDIDAALSATRNPVVLSSIHGHVDLGLPAATPANLKLGTIYGDIFVDPEFKIDVERTENMIKYSDKVNGKINGGGLEIALSSTHSNVYLRKK